jgi:toxin ParE1/3/4
MRIVWLTRARRDFDRQIQYIAGHNPSAAIEQDLLISQAINRLADYPFRGRAGRRKASRELVVPHKPFIAIYRTATDRNEIHVLRILHASQKWPPE